MDDADERDATPPGLRDADDVAELARRRDAHDRVVGPERRAVRPERAGGHREDDRVRRVGVPAVQRRGGQARVIRGAVADHVDPAHPVAPQPGGDVARGGTGLGERGADGVGSLDDLARDDGRRHGVITTSTPRSRSAAASSARTPLSVTSVVTWSMSKTKAGATVRNLLESARTMQSRDARRRARSVRISGIESFIEREIRPDRPDAHVQRVRPELAERELGDVPKGGMHAGADDAAEHDQLDPGAIHEDRRHVERVGDDREATVHEPAREVERRRAAGDEDRLAVGDAGRGGVRDGLLGGQTWVGWIGEGRAAKLGATVGPDDPTVVGEAGEVAPDRGWRHAEVARQRLHRDAAIGTDAVEQPVASSPA